MDSRLRRRSLGPASQTQAEAGEMEESQVNDCNLAAPSFPRGRKSQACATRHLDP